MAAGAAPTQPTHPAATGQDEDHVDFNAPPTQATAHSDHNRGKGVLRNLYVSHTLSTWNSRTFEFAAVIFLARIFPGTLLYASCYALFRSLAAALLGSWLGDVADRRERLPVLRASIVGMRVAVAVSCYLFLNMLSATPATADGEVTGPGVLVFFPVTVGLACVEKLASVVNTVSVERDWIVVVSEALDVDREVLNGQMRRIDLVCKLVAPLGISVLDGYSTRIAVWTVLGLSVGSVGIEYFTIASVYNALPELGVKMPQATDSPSSQTSPNHSNQAPQKSKDVRPRSRSCLSPWKAYLSHPAFLASFSLSLLYLTVLSFSSQMTTYLLTTGLTPLHISLLRLLAVLLELAGTFTAPLLQTKIGSVRAGLWFVNWQLLALFGAVVGYLHLSPTTRSAALVLVAGVLASRPALWSFDLTLQSLIQSSVAAPTRTSFSATEAALQNLFEALSFLSTVIFSQPQDFQIPVVGSVVAVAVAAVCFAAFVRRERGHLTHVRQWGCCGREGKRYEILPTIEEEGEEEVEMEGFAEGGRS